MSFVVGLLIGVALGILLRDICNKLHFYMQLGIAARRQREERDKAIKDLEEFINKDKGAEMIWYAPVRRTSDGNDSP